MCRKYNSSGIIIEKQRAKPQRCLISSAEAEMLMLRQALEDPQEIRAMPFGTASGWNSAHTAWPHRSRQTCRVPLSGPVPGEPVCERVSINVSSAVPGLANRTGQTAGHLLYAVCHSLCTLSHQGGRSPSGNSCSSIAHCTHRLMDGPVFV